MTKNNLKVLLIGTSLAVLPAAALAAPYTRDGGAGFWTGPYAGGQIGLNEASGDGISTESAFTGGVHLGYNAAIPLNSAYSPLIVGADAFAEFNGESTHSFNGFGRPSGPQFGSNVYGVDALAGLSVGVQRQIMPYIKVGFGTLDGTGDLNGNDTSTRIGVGAEYHFRPHIGLTAQWMHQDADHITNNNFTVGVNYHFGGY